MMNSIEIVKHIDKILNHLKPLLPLANCHMVDFFTTDVFKTHLTSEMQLEINSLPYAQVIESIFENNFANLPLLQNYFECCRECTLFEKKDICLTLDQFYSKLEAMGCKDINSFRLDIFMNKKKSHEVEILGSVVSALKEIGGTSHVIDIGDGKGYLSSMLALHHKIPVLGIDASQCNSMAAVKRVQKLEKIWHNIYNNPKKSKPKKDDLNITPSNQLYKQVTRFVDPNLNFNEIITNAFNDEVRKISLSGLHTCGNLSPTCLKIFIDHDSVVTLSNVGCCYHLLNERFESNTSEPIGFPLSRYLNNENICIGRNARMVAAQSVSRIFHKKELPDISIFYRALLQVYLLSNYKDLPTKPVGKMRKNYDNFREYAKIALGKLELDADDVEISDALFDDLYNQYESRLNELNVFYLIRCMLSPVIESLILLDRLLFLLEEGHRNSFLVQLFDPVVSPRCFGVMSIKTDVV